MLISLIIDKVSATQLKRVHCDRLPYQYLSVATQYLKAALPAFQCLHEPRNENAAFFLTNQIEQGRFYLLHSVFFLCVFRLFYINEFNQGKYTLCFLFHYITYSILNLGKYVFIFQKNTALKYFVWNSPRSKWGW